MKTSRLGVVAIAITLLAAAGWIAASTASAGEDAAAQTAAADQQMSKPDPAQIARGAKAWATTCMQCHNLRDPKEFSDKSWDIIVNHMRVVGPLPGQEAEDIKAFLKSAN